MRQSIFGDNEFTRQIDEGLDFPFAHAKRPLNRRLETVARGRISFVGIFADYLRLAQTDTNYAGLGARVGVIAYHNVKLEGEMSYDFDQAFTESFRDSTTGAITVRRTGMRTLHGEFGPKVNLGEHWHVHPFVTLKGGFVNFRLNSEPATIGTL